ncbi:hypothetical protein EYF80_052250 [Liparis tanakae]|uniref:Uncharacterized protein n=1 Tax=Liparis tanakae TaxID=230148 RepID=A0A4Z2F8U6_9TELE|nr:hypothetical protein EYF80_052250 [Liparis tanakae]
MTLLSSRREANTRRRFPTLRHCSRLSKSTCSSRESTGRHRVSTWQSNRSNQSTQSTGYLTSRAGEEALDGDCASRGWKGGLHHATHERRHHHKDLEELLLLQLDQVFLQASLSFLLNKPVHLNCPREDVGRHKPTKRQFYIHVSGISSD